MTQLEEFIEVNFLILNFLMHEPIFTIYYYKKRVEGKAYRVALSHVAKKLVRAIYKLEISDIPFNSSKLK